MCTKNTRELEEILENTHTGTYDQYCRTYENSLLSSLNPFGVYLKECLKNNHITQQQTFLRHRSLKDMDINCYPAKKRPGKEM